MKRLCECYLIDAANKTITATSYLGLSGLQTLIGGYIETAYMWENGDVLFVDEEGLLKPEDKGRFMIFERSDQVLMGNGVLVGREVDNDGNTDPPAMTIDALRGRVAFGLADIIKRGG